jgi:hypothetical protein
MINQTNILAVFNNDRDLVSAIAKLREKNIPIRDAWTPFPVHDVLKLLGKESRLPYFAVFAGASAIVLVFLFLYYTAVIDYPIRYGGKPIFSFPSFVVVIYLLTILLTFTATTAVFQARTGLYPGKDADVLFARASDDKFIISLGQNEGISDDLRSQAREILKESGAVEIVER